MSADAKKVRTSTSFQSLKVPESLIDLFNVKRLTTPKGTEVIFVPYKDQKLNNYLVSILDPNGVVVATAFVQFESKMTKV